jgi:protein TonB
MSAAEAVPASAILAENANDRLKRSFDSWFWGSMIVATVVHFGAFTFAPEMTVDDVSFTSEELETIVMPPEIEIPPPPRAISRPATPVIAAADVSEDITIALTTFDDNPIEDLPPPPEEIVTDIAAAPTFTPYTVAPALQNLTEVQRVLMREYPSVLRDSGIGGRVTVWFFIDEEGRVQQTRLDESSGYDALDQAAINVAEVYRFSPALNRENRVQVWVSLPITFQVR